MITMLKDKMYYFGTTTDVRVGDNIEVRMWFRWKRAIVYYIPGQSQIDPELEYDDVSCWAIQLENGNIYSMAYDPAHRLGQPSKSYRFISRKSNSAQQGDAPEPATIADPASPRFQPPAR